MNSLIAVIPKNATEELRVTLTEFGGHDLCDLRVFTEYASGETGPTKRGVTLRVGQLAALIEALVSAEATARNAGLTGRVRRRSDHGDPLAASAT